MKKIIRKNESFLSYKFGGDYLKNKNNICWSRRILGWSIFIAVSIVMIFNCVPVLTINEVNISQKIMMIFGLLVCEYGWILLIKRFVFGIK